MTYINVDEATLRPIRAVPDAEPVEFPWSPCVLASWITEELKRETADG